MTFFEHKNENNSFLIFWKLNKILFILFIKIPCHNFKKFVVKSCKKVTILVYFSTL